MTIDTKTLRDLLATLEDDSREGAAQFEAAAHTEKTAGSARDTETRMKSCPHRTQRHVSRPLAMTATDAASSITAGWCPVLASRCSLTTFPKEPV